MACRAARHIVISPTTGSWAATGTAVRIAVPRDGYSVAIGGAEIIPGRVCIIDWGDGSVTRLTESWRSAFNECPQHVYQLGAYTITVSDTVTSLAFATDDGVSPDITAVLSIGSRITALDPGMFRYCSSIPPPAVMRDSSIVDMPEEEDIYYGAFAHCTSLDGDLSWFPSGVSGTLQRGIFQGCTGIESLIGLPVGEGEIDKIGDAAFEGCRSLSVTGSLGCVKEIGVSSFSGCSSLTVAPTRGDEPYKSTIDEPGMPRARKIGDYAFSYCSSIVTFETPWLQPWFGDYAFQGCTSLRTIKPLSLSYLTFNVNFSDGTSYYEIMPRDGRTLMNDVASITKSGNSLTVTLLDGVEITRTYGKNIASTSNLEYWYYNDFENSGYVSSIIGKGCFSGCTALTSTAGMPFSVREWPEECFSYSGVEEIVDVFGCPVDFDRFPNYARVAEGSYDNSDFTFNGKNSLLTLGPRCFGYCNGLTGKVELLGVKEIKERCFERCENLSGVEFIPKGVTQRYGYYGITAEYGEITATSYVERIGPYAFYRCTNGEDYEIDYEHPHAKPAGCEEFVIKIDSRFCPDIAPDAFSGIRSKPVATFAGNPFSAWVVVQLRTPKMANGIYVTTGTTKPDGPVVLPVPTSSWATDSNTSQCLRIQYFREINQEITDKCVILEQGTVQNDASTGAVISFSRVYVSGAYYLRNLRVSIPMGTRIDAPIGTEFSLPIIWYEGASVGGSYPVKEYFTGRLVGWDYRYITDQTYGPQGHPILEITTDVPYEKWSSSEFDPTGATHLRRTAFIYTVSMYATAKLHAAQTLISSQDTAEEGGNLNGLRFVADFVGDPNIPDGADDISVDVTLTQPTWVTDPETGDEQAQGSTQTVVNLSLKKVGEKLIVNMYNVTGKIAPVFEVVTNRNYVKGSSAVISAETDFGIKTDSKIHGSFWPLTPNQMAEINVQNGYYRS